MKAIDFILAAADVMAQVEKDQDQAAYREGVFVRALGRPLDRNPYPPKSREGLLWEEGWRLIDARHDIVARYDEPPPKPMSELISKPSTNLLQDSGRKQKAPSARLFFLAYLFFFITFGGFLLFMLMNITRLMRD